MTALQLPNYDNEQSKRHFFSSYINWVSGRYINVYSHPRGHGPTLELGPWAFSNIIVNWLPRKGYWTVWIVVFTTGTGESMRALPNYYPLVEPEGLTK